MDSFAFLDGYQELRDHRKGFNHRDRARHNFDTPEVKQIMTGPREWASFFDKIFYSILEGNTDIDREAIDQQLTIYETEWAGDHLDYLITESQNLAFHDAEATQAVNELNFHILTKKFMPLWHHAWMPEKYPEVTPEGIETVQTRLATRAAELIQVKNSALKWRRIENSPKGLVSAINGQLTEIDAAIVMLEMQKENPQLMVLPAGPQFESARPSNRSVDFIITDTDTWQSRGIQVKTYIERFEDAWKTSQQEDSQKPIRNYDSNYVTLIDGMVDLGNFTVRRIAGKGEVMVPNPGQISLTFLEDSKHPDILKAKNNIQGRILHDLNKS